MKARRVEKATIASGGVLRDERAWLAEKVREWKDSAATSAAASASGVAQSAEGFDKSDVKPGLHKENV